MWWKFLVLLFFVIALNLEHQIYSTTTFYQVGIDSLNISRSLCDSWERFYASKGIKFGKVVFAQYTWETDWGNSDIFKENHNGYGMKYRKLKNPLKQIALGEKNGHAYYRNHAASVRDYARWQKQLLREHPEVDTNEEYLALLDDYNVSWCPDCRYAEDLTYTKKIRQRMQKLASL